MDDVNAIVFFLGMMSGGFIASIFLVESHDGRPRLV